MMFKKRVVVLLWLVAALVFGGMGTVQADSGKTKADEAQIRAVEASRALVPTPPWPAGDECGMANTLGPGTWVRCGYHLGVEGAKVYELSHERSNSMPLSPFGRPLEYGHRFFLMDILTTKGVLRNS